MQAEAFISQVEARAGLDGTETAAQATSEVLRIFGRLDLRGELRDVASQLPRRISAMLLAEGESQTFSDTEFVSRVGEALDLSEPEAEQVATAVLTTVREALTDGQFLDLGVTLPAEFNRFINGE